MRRKLVFRTRQRPVVRENKKKMYDVWKLQTPEEYYDYDFECYECGCSTDYAEYIGIHPYCLNCFKELNGEEETK